MEEKNLTIQQKKQRYRRAEIASLIGEYAVVPIPFLIMAIINRDKWFPNAEIGTKVGIGGGLAIGLMLFAIFLITKNKQQESENKVETGYIVLMLGWALLSVICTLIANIMDQMATIMWVGLSGIAAGFGLDVTRKVMRKKYLKEKDYLDTAERNEMIQQASEERKTIKIKVKK